MSRIIDNFQARLDEAVECCRNIGSALRGKEQIRWMFSVQDSDGNDKPGKFDLSGIHESFSRLDAEKDYAEAKSPNATRQDQAIAKVQSDVLSGMERDFFMRHRPRIRRLAHHACMTAHAGSELGPITSGMMFYLQGQLKRVPKARTE